MIWPITLCLLISSLDARMEIKTSLLPGKSVINVIPDLLRFSGTAKPVTANLDTNPGLSTPRVNDSLAIFTSTSYETQTDSPDVYTMPDVSIFSFIGIYFCTTHFVITAFIGEVLFKFPLSTLMASFDLA